MRWVPPISFVLLLAGCADQDDRHAYDDVSDDDPGDDDAGDDDAGDDDAGVDEDAAPPCVAPGVIDVAESSIELFFWGGNPDPEIAVGTIVTTAACEGFSVTSEAGWLAPSIGVDGRGLVITVSGDAVSSGRSTGTVAIQDGPNRLAEVEVRLSALVSPATGGMRMALVVGVDGVDGEVLPVADTPVLDLLKEGGTWTASGSTQRTGATSSGPGWTSLLTGVEVSRHGVTTNGQYAGRNLDYPSFLLRLKETLGLTTAAAIQWGDIFAILEPGVLDDSSGGDQGTVRDWMAALLADGDQQVHFVHYDDVDHFGHSVGYVAEAPDYVAAIEQADADIGVLLDAILDRPTVGDEEWLIIVSTDHGGTAGGGHGAMNPDCQTIPIFAAGPSVPRLALDPGQGSHLDVHPTVLDFFGLDPSDYTLDGEVLGSLRETDCDDGLDGDADGAVDCQDADCADEAACWDCDADNDLGSAIGDVAALAPTADRLEGSCGGESGTESILTWTAPAAGTWVFDTMNWYRDTVLYLREDVCTGAELACNDSPEGMDRSVVTADLAQGQQITVVVDTDGSDATATGLSIHPTSATCPDEALTVGSGATTLPFTHQETAHAGTCPPMIADRWYTWTVPSAGPWTIDTTGSDFDTVLYVLDGCGGSELGCNDDVGGLQSAVTVMLGAGDEIVVGAGSFAGRAERGTLVINVTPQ